MSSKAEIIPLSNSMYSGMSQSADLVFKSIQEIVSRLQVSVALGMDGKGVVAELESEYMNCQISGWDGFDAQPVDFLSFKFARLFLSSLPLGTTPPKVSAEPDGQITLEWYLSPRQVLSISFDPSGQLHYAGLFGQNKSYGTEYFDDHVPESILALIKRAI